MIVLHAGAIDGHLYVWGERPNAMTVPTRAVPGREGYPRPRPHWFDAGAEALDEAIEFGAPSIRMHNRQIEAVVAWLPTQGIGPVPSRPELGKAPNGREQIAPWIVSGQRLSAADLVALATTPRESLTPDCDLAPDFVYWIDVARFAVSAVVRHLYLPQVDEGRAVWRPVLQGEAAEFRDRLASRMPSSARALAPASRHSPPAEPAASVVDRTLGRMIDAIVRRASPLFALPDLGVSGRRSAAVTAYDAWIAGLRASESTPIAGPAAGIERLANDAGLWRSPLDAAADAPYRLAFRIDPPEHADDDDTWHLRFLLQSTDDASRTAPLADAWRSLERAGTVAGPDATLVEEDLDDLHALIRASLHQAGQVSRALDPIESGLGERLATGEAPDDLVLDNAGAHSFLANDARSLLGMGFGVVWPNWWSRRPSERRIEVYGRVESPPETEAPSLLAEIPFDVEIALGGEPLTDAEIERLAAAQHPLVRLRSRWVEVDPEEMQRTVAFWRARSGTVSPVRSLIHLSLGVDRESDGIPFRGVKATGWVGELLDKLEGEAAFEEFQPEPTFAGQLRPYQIRGFSWLCFLRRWGLGACLADDMGLGKTVQALAVMQREWHHTEPDRRRPTLVVCPTSVVNNWPREVALFTPDLPVLVHHGPRRATGDAFAAEASKYALVVTSYGLLNRDLDALQSVRWLGMVLDEAQHIRNPDTKQARAARAIESDYRAALTGTPVENNVADLWSIFAYLNPGLLGTRASFKREFFAPIQTERDAAAVDRLKRLTRPFVLRRLKTDKRVIADLPEKIETKVFTPLSREQAALYQAVLDETAKALDTLQGIERRGVILSTITRLKQVCNHPAHYLRDGSELAGRAGKLTRLTEILEEVLAGGYAALVFTQFREMGFLLQRHLAEKFSIEVPFLHGGVAKNKRDEMVDRFQHVDGPPVFLLSVKAGGTGLNLTRASHVFHYDRWWNPAVENQATDRAYRIGQTKNVQVHKFVTPGTLEERVDQLLERKSALAEDVVGTGEGWLTQLSDQELRDVLKLSIDEGEVERAAT